MENLTLEYTNPRELSDNYIWCSTWSGTKLILPFHMFEQMQICNQSFNDLKHFTENYNKLRRTFCGGVANEKVYIEYKNTVFAFSCAWDCKCYLWDESGTMAVGEVAMKSFMKSPTDEFISELRELLDNYIDGNIHCSDCGKLISMKGIAGSYFAGRYCKNCWDGKWKEIESRETYE